MSDLLELCEPVMQYVCRLNQSARTGAIVDLHQTRRDIEDFLKDFRTRASADPVLVSSTDDVELILTFFVDGMIASGQSNIASEWHVARLAYDWRGGPEMNGDEKFFELLDRALKDKSDAATQKVALFYTCIGLGFTGWYAGQADYLRRKMLECSNRIRTLMDTNQRALICSDAYTTDTRNLIQKPTRSLVGISIALVGLMGVLFAAYYLEYRSTEKELNDAFDKVINSSQSSIGPSFHDQGVSA